MPTRSALSLAAALVAVLTAGGCTKDAPTNPTPSGPKVWNLTGSVKRADTGALVVGASVEVIDGPNANRTAVTNTSGVYTFTGLTEGGFTVRVRHADYQEMAQGVTLTADRVLDFAVVKVPRADLAREGVAVYYPQPPNYTTWTFTGHGLNRGDGCANGIIATFRLTNALGAEVPGSIRTLALPAGLMVRPLERFDYGPGCCYTTAELDLAAGYDATFIWTPTGCP